MKNYFDKEYELRYFEMNEFGVASPTSMLTLLEETAAEHCSSIGHSLYQLAEENKGWVLVSGMMQMDRYPKYKEKITIRTWLSDYSLIKGTRENLIYDEDKNIIGRAKGMWAFFDIEKRRPIALIDEIIEKWGSCEEVSLEANIAKKIKAVESPDYQLKFKINRFDTDIIKHLNNIRYLQWLIETIPLAITDSYYLISIDGRFIAEAHYGQTILLLTKTITDGDDISYLHTMKIEETGKVCATAKTVWREID
ncbi:acyl-[acyl-carrier-protein] thioesterase [Crocinitomix catalasitica]|uniref:acyl-[acyl-carrier-protein] thioesterase n=1 Tax=Crocinitomix catalasitica TaxID=184607 RepID=UPI000486BD26|nr:acyl-ACP thioesterase domain-containing protein [Crocinitomix catalasitica]